MRKPAIPMDELRQRYEALGVIEEMMGERSYLGRCSTFEGFLGYGPLQADDQRAPMNYPLTNAEKCVYAPYASSRGARS